jgi:mono/diheme cytochrome c family protein
VPPELRNDYGARVRSDLARRVRPVQAARLLRGAMGQRSDWRTSRHWAISLALAVALLPLVARSAAEPVSFTRDIRPVLAEKCLSCHGPDASQRQAGLRLDLPNHAVRPGRPAESRMLVRVTAADPRRRMPPPGVGKPLTLGEIRLLRSWIAGGAGYRGHWAFEPPAAPPFPAAARFRSPIDAFVTAGLRRRGLELAPEAAPDVQLRRVTLGLTGLPPTAGERTAFHADLARPGADPSACYERVVDRLLRSPHLGEHLAGPWLDAARYADTNGYFGDKPRQMWLWRDWVINAFNTNKPFDQFTIEQLGGDLLPNPTLQQRIATGFHRNQMANDETGIIDEEFRTESVADRVHTTMAVWQGLTAGCAQCHDHKFDPLSQREFYQLFAFFNNGPEKGLINTENPAPRIEVPSPEQTRRLAEAAREAEESAAAFAPVKQRLGPDIARWERAAGENLLRLPSTALVLHEPFNDALAATTGRGTPLLFERGVRGKALKLDATRHAETPLPGFLPDDPWTLGLWVRPDGALSCPLSLIEPAGNRRGVELLLGKGILRVHLVERWGVSAIVVATREKMAPQQWHHLVVAYDGSRRAAGLRVFVDGRPAPTEVRLDALRGSLRSGEPLRVGRRDAGLGFYGGIDELRLFQQALDAQAIEAWYWGERIRGILALSPPDRTAPEGELLLDYYLDRFGSSEDRAARERAKKSELALAELRAGIPTALVLEELPQPRTTHVMLRGQYDRPGEIVTAGVPVAIAPWSSELPKNRLGLAKWLFSPRNPLTARVAVNRFWQQLFGEGLVRTPDDFGSRGEPPTHPELLDWLAVSFRDSGWNVKALLRTIVTSRTYRQRSELRLRDGQPFDLENRLLARGPSFRLSAEMLRDQALAVSGLLAPKIGGPSVKPPQPAGLWEAVSYNAEETYVPDAGAGRWRRSLYTYVKRQAPPPALLTFDGPTREKCVLRRPRTNTPLQALVLLNDETFVEAARVLGARSGLQAGSEQARLCELWRTVLVREPRPEEVGLLSGLLTRQRKRFAADPAAAGKLLAIGTAPRPVGDPVEPAAWTVVAQAVLNLDEAVTLR